MFYEQCCILCLEKCSITENSISLDSNEQQTGNALQTIEQHFKEELIMLTHISSKIVCKQCWALVQSFHEFYIKIKNAHLTAWNKLNSLQELEISVAEIKAEPDEIDKLASPASTKYEDMIDVAIDSNSLTQMSDDEKFEAFESDNKPKDNIQAPCTTATKKITAERKKRQTRKPAEIKSEETKYEDTINEAIDSISPTQMSNDEKFEASESDNKPKDNMQAECTTPTKKITAERKKRQTRKPTEIKSEEKPKTKSSHKTFDSNAFIAQHFKLECLLCEEPITSFRALKIHFRDMHQANGYVKCCGKKLFKRALLVDHLHTHNDPEYFKCQHCAKVLSDRSGLETHLQNYHDPKEPTIYKCDICSKSFYRRKVLARHLLIHAPEEAKKVQCTECDKRFCNQYSMKQHLALVHLNLYAKICDICGKALKGNEAFQRHLDEHAGVPRSPNKCKVCNAELKTKYGLARHMKAMHTVEGQTPQVCTICSKKSPSVRAHQSHMKNVHTNKIHTCKLCDKTFKRSRHLIVNILTHNKSSAPANKEHMTTHTGEVLYTCTFCPQTFNSNANMYAHRKRKHPKEWEEKCTKRRTTTGMVQHKENDQ